MDRMKLLAVLLLAAVSCGDDGARTITVATPFGPLAYPLVYMKAHSPLAGRLRLAVWKSPDQLRAMIGGGQADYYALPVNVAALYHTKDEDIVLADVSIWGVLWVVSTDSTKRRIEDFRSEMVMTPFRGNVPNLVFARLAREAGMEIGRDITLTYAKTPFDAIQQLLTGHVENAVLSEPECSILLHRAESLRADDPAIPVFYRAVDLQETWGRLFDTAPEIPLGGLAASRETLADRSLTMPFLDEYRRATEWCAAHPEETGALVARYFEGIDAEPVAEAARHIRQHSADAVSARPAVEAFLSLFLESDPESVGGDLPGDSFYFDSREQSRTPDTRN